MEKDMEQVMKKAEVLIEALPYIQKFNRKIIVVKYGGSAMSNEELQKNVIKDVTLLKLVGFKPIIVHGGGKEISRWVGKVGKEAKFINGLRVTGKKKEDCKIVVNGAGSAGVAITKLLLTYGFPKITMCDINGIISADSPNLNWMQKEMTKVTNLDHETGTLADALKGADIFVGVSAPGIVTEEMVASMNSDAILFAMANPVPEIMPDLAKKAGARVVGTGRSDFPNQVNNVVAFPGIFRGALEGHAKQITDKMKLAAANAIAALVSDEDLNENNIMPEAFDPRVADVVADAVKRNIR